MFLAVDGGNTLVNVDQINRIDLADRNAVNFWISGKAEPYTLDGEDASYLLALVRDSDKKAREYMTYNCAPKPPQQCIVRQFSREKNEWIWQSAPISHEEAEQSWNQLTANGTQHAKYEDGDYFEILPLPAER